MKIKMIMKLRTRKLLQKILFSNQKSGVSGVFCELELLFLLQNVKYACRGVLYIVKFQAINLHLY